MPKYKVVKTIIDEEKRLIGLVIQAKEKDLGGFSSNVVEQPMPIPALKGMNNGLGFHNYQVDVNKNGLSERGNFRLNNIPMIMYSNASGYTVVNNNIALVGRYEKENQNIGFDVDFGNGEVRALSYNNVVTLSRWFKPTNFMVSTITKSDKVRTFIKGNGIKIDELPVNIIGEQSNAKKTRSGAQDATKKFSNKLESGFDILDVYDLISKYKGQVIKLPGEKYVPANTLPENTSAGFISYGIGEVASPKLQFNATKLNVNAGFKKVGYVPVQINGGTTNITTYIYRSKSLFFAGENYIRTFGIAVPCENEKDLIQALGASLAIEKITDPSITAPLGQVIDAQSLAFYKVTSDKLELISAEKRKKSVMTAQQIANLCKEQYSLKLISKYAGPRSGVMKQLKDENGAVDLGEKLGKRPFNTFALMDKATLQFLESQGFDIYTGAYNNQTHGGAKKSTEETTKVEIVYSLKEFDASKITAQALINAVKSGDTSKIPNDVVNAINKIEAITNINDKYKTASEVYRSAEDRLAEIAKLFWMHNAAMYIAGDKQKVHTYDRADWEEVSTRAKNAQMFANKKVAGLTVKLTGVSI